MVKLHVVLPKDLIGLVEVIKVLMCMERFEEHVIYVDLHGIIELLGKHLVDQPLVGCTCVL